MKAGSDPDDEVRNNAVRALGIPVRARPSLASMIRLAPSIAMLSSGAWTDRNKAASLLAAMTFLGRVAGIPEDRLRELAERGPVEEITTAAITSSP